jgi:hypothetical protein
MILIFYEVKEDEIEGMEHEWERRGTHIGYLWGKPEGKRPLGRTRRM